MSTTSIDEDSAFPVASPDHGEGARHASHHKLRDSRAGDAEPGLLEMLSLSSWRTLALETAGLFVAIAALKHWFFGGAEIPGMPHPYWLVVILASSQYGVIGGMIVTVVATSLYLFDVTPRSAVQELYSYAGMVVAQPTAWLATALIIGGLRSMHIYQAAELTRNLRLSRRRANDLADGLEHALAEITALEQRIATDTSSAAALSRGFSKIDLSDRRAAAASFGELFRFGADTTTFTIYLKSSEGYLPVLAVEDDVTRPAKSIEPLQPATVAAMMKEKAGAGRHVVLVPPADVSPEPLAVIVCQPQLSPQDPSRVRRRTDELSRAFGKILSACPDHAPRGRQ